MRFDTKHRMDANALQLQVEIVDAGSLAEAARRLKMTRANVSYHLNQLERALGTQLVRRTPRRLEATEVGQRLYLRGQAIQNELLAAREEASTLSQSLRGRVRLSVPSGYGHLVMTDWLLAFKRLYPGIALQLLFENRVDDLLRDEVDVAVRVLPEPPLSLVAREIGSARYLVCATPDFAAAHGLPATPDDLQHWPLIASSLMGAQIRLQVRRGAEQRVLRLEPTLGSEHYPFLRSAIAAGLGLGITPRYVVDDLLCSGQLVSVLDDWRFDLYGTLLYLLYMPNRLPTRAARTLIDFITERAAGGAPAPER